MEEQTVTALELQNRQLLRMNGVQTIEVFDEEQIVLQTVLGRLYIQGEQLNVISLDLELGNIQIAGSIDGLRYVSSKAQQRSNQKKEKPPKQQSLLQRLLS